VRAQLHSIMAPYLGDPDYEAAKRAVTAVFAHQRHGAKQNGVPRHSGHAPVHARTAAAAGQVLPGFCGDPANRPDLLDIACGLNPLAFPWMGLPTSTQFYAYDIHEPRIDFLNHYFRAQGLAPLAKVQDVAHVFPQETADVALFLKEMPRFTRNYGDLGRPLLQALNVRWLVVSYPEVSTHGGRNLTHRYREFMGQLTDGLPWTTTEILFDGELVFCIEKSEDKP
ncbi:MAG: hypothetical protein IPJ94_21160, partial [Chloroflexi bacterium]|nr:hypothetical protein [Chloroflexota bacterium]